MDRRADRKFSLFRRRLMSRQLQIIIQLAVLCLLSTTVILLSIKYFYPSLSNFMVPTTRRTTTTTTTISTTTVTKKTTTESSFGAGCFFDKTNITLADGSTRSLDLLNVGDEVLVYSSFGQIKKSRVLTVFHHQRSLVRFLDIYTTNDQEPLRLTPSHSILIQKANVKQSSFHYDFASNIAIGDFVFSSTFQPLQVINIKEIILYNQTISTPLTFEGHIIVNNLLASCYATYHHKFMHILTIPIRYWYRIETFPRFNNFIIHFIDFYSKINF